MMILLIIFVLAGGILAGYFLLPASFVALAVSSSHWILYLMLFLIGAEMAFTGDIWGKLKKMPKLVFCLPLFSIVGSVLGGALTGLFLNLGFWQGAAIGGGMGWYSISGAILTASLGAQYGAIAFLTNIIRELLTFLLVPLLFELDIGIAALTIGGATTMDTTLPIISRCGGSDVTMIAILHGVVCSAAVPILLSLLVSFVGR